MKALIAATLLALCLAAPTFARELIVAPDGSDANPGTLTQPLATLRQACALARPGDSIALRAGDYKVSTYWDSGADGTPGRPIVVRSYDGPRAARIGSFTLHGKQYIEVVGLDIDGTGGGNAFHVDGHSQYIMLRDCYVHDAGRDGDCIKINQCDYITIEGNEVARPGMRRDGETYQEGIDFVDVDFSVMRNNYVHDFGDMALYTKGGSGNTIIEGNVISHQLNADLNPATGFGQQTDLRLMDGADYQSYHCVFRNNIIRDCPGGAIGTYDASDAYFYNNLVVNCGDRSLDHGIVHQRTSTTWKTEEGDAGRTTGVRFFNNVFLDTRGEMPTVYQYRSGNYAGCDTGHNNYYNAGKPIPSAGLVDPNAERGATFGNPWLSRPTGTATTRAGWLALYRPTARSRALIDRGLAAGRQPQPAVLTDITGARRPSGKYWDIGPFEWQPPARSKRG